MSNPVVSRFRDAADRADADRVPAERPLDHDPAAALREYAKRFHDLVDGSLQGIMVTHGPKPIFANAAFAEMLGYTAEEIVRLDSWEHLVAPDERQRVVEICQDRAAGRDAPARYEYKALRKDGGIVWFENLSRQVIWDGQPATQATVIDITERKTIALALRAAMLAANEANRTKSEFLATMSHEFRTPLNAILGFSDMIRSQAFTPVYDQAYKDYAEEIYKGGQYMLSLVNDVLDIAAIESGNREFKKASISTNALLKEAVKVIAVAAEEKRIELRLDVPDGLPALRADERACTQILHTLLSNAVKFTDPGGEITVGTRANGKALEITVADTGRGIAPDQLASVTEPFSQAHSDPFLSEQGTGLGLSIVKSLIEAHDGVLEIESEVDAGTRVTVRFPL